MLVASARSAESPEADEWRRNVTNLVVATSTVEMLALRIDQVDRVCAPVLDASRSVVKRLRAELRDVESRLSRIQSFARSQAQVHLGAQSEAEHFRAVSLSNGNLVDRVRSEARKTPQVNSERCSQALTSYEEQLNEIKQLANSLESQPNLQRK